MGVYRRGMSKGAPFFFLVCALATVGGAVVCHARCGRALRSSTGFGLTACVLYQFYPFH